MYQIKEKIDSTNEAEFEKELMAAKPAELDASQLEYNPAQDFARS